MPKTCEDLRFPLKPNHQVGSVTGEHLDGETTFQLEIIDHKHVTEPTAANLTTHLEAGAQF